MPSMFDLLSEGTNEFFKKQTFYNAAKKYAPEFKKIVTQYFANKHVVFIGGSTNIDFGKGFAKKNADKTDSKEVTKLKNSFVSINLNFFAATDSINGKIVFPTIIYKNYRISDITFYTNETFFDGGHDFTFSVGLEVDPTRAQYKSFKYKIDLMRNIYDVLDDMWGRITKAIDDFDNLSTDNSLSNVTGEEHKVSVKSNIERTFEFILGKEMKNVKDPITQKKTREIAEIDGNSPVKFKLNYVPIPKITSSFKTLEHPSFQIVIDLTVRDPKGKGFMKRNPDIMEKFEKYQEIANLSPITHHRVYSIDNLLPSKVYEENEEVYIRKLRTFCKRVAQFGYFPQKSDKVGERESKDQITFVYSPKLEKLFINDKNEAMRISLNQIQKVVESAISKRGFFVGKIDYYFQEMLGHNFAQWYLIKNDKTSEDGQKYIEAFTTKSSIEARKKCIRCFFQ